MKLHLSPLNDDLKRLTLKRRNPLTAYTRSFFCGKLGLKIGLFLR
jgi:hypothetical protein